MISPAEHSSGDPTGRRCAGIRGFAGVSGRGLATSADIVDPTGPVPHSIQSQVSSVGREGRRLQNSDQAKSDGRHGKGFRELQMRRQKHTGRKGRLHSSLRSVPFLSASSLILFLSCFFFCLLPVAPNAETKVVREVEVVSSDKHTDHSVRAADEMDAQNRLKGSSTGLSFPVRVKPSIQRTSAKPTFPYLNPSQRRNVGANSGHRTATRFTCSSHTILLSILALLPHTFPLSRTIV